MQTSTTFAKLLTYILTPIIFISVGVSCQKQNIPKTPLFNPDFKDIQLRSGFLNNPITIQAKDWSVEYVKNNMTGVLLKDVHGEAMSLKDSGTIELQGGWLTLEKKAGESQLFITLKENFKATPRRFSIGIRSGGQRDELSFTQSIGEGYTIVKKEFSEIPGSRKEYTSDKGCLPISLSNNSSVGKYMETSSVFKDVRYVSIFSSEDLNAFGWISAAPDTLIRMDKIYKDGAVVWNSRVRYKKGRSEAPFTIGGTLKVPPHMTVKVRGEIQYLERKCRYTFTIKNQSSGRQFTISGLWQQTIPLMSTLILYE